MSFIACQQQQDKIDVSFPYQKGSSSFAYRDQLSISGMSAMIPTYDLFNMEFGNEKRFYGGVNFCFINADLPNSVVDFPNSRSEVFLGYNLKLSPKIILGHP
jgi:hypothetical protein